MAVALPGPDGSVWYTAAETADILGIVHDAVHVYVGRKLLTPVEFGNQSVFNSREIEAYLLRRRRPGRPKPATKTATPARPRRGRSA
jgi:hypothetical protein